MYVQRLGAFVLSGVLAGFAGGLYVHLLPLNAGALYLDLPSGTRVIVEGVLMALALIARPSGLTGGREFRLPRLRRGGPGPAAPATPDAA
jgi:ABC-type branched-subunit amino acid transport system permease subunit